VVPMISVAITYKQEGPAEFKGYEYGRSGNPTRDTLQECLAALEHAEHCRLFASGMSAVVSQFIVCSLNLIRFGIQKENEKKLFCG
jgi:cystathionine gamma-lyase